ncbi:unnamed protein product (macronuclear) [Paramecium tetraurelia]|uniref:Myb-like domain-containing protein n=1 Tax=Paramecium tetraurelia TaxID=5888 RepID=A0DWZ8_PARTE|nr:uncharacterized protein GSPATT00021197001 [Paramecium tetraurelia]CAK87565.1 unnamed protein product [Paramecium tetraurelia]|eukprot:XP_001454962.1 hypothetical protein (macronuclear) [Paramecium tetraurelia strain d4-2]
MHPFTQFPPFFQYSQTYNYPWTFMEQFNQFRNYFYINNNNLLLNYHQAQPTNLLFEGSQQPASMIKQENSVIQSNFEPVEIMKNLENHKSPLPLKKRPNISFSNNKRKGKKSTKRKLYNIGHWTTKEHNLYLSFIQTNKDIMLNSDLKKQNKIFKQMSNFIKTRSPSQCRSHHQKFDPNDQGSNNASNFTECQDVENQE